MLILVAFFGGGSEGGCEHNEGNEEQPTMSKRKDYINWDDYFMAVAFLSAMRSKDPSTQVGACIVNDENKIVGIGKWGPVRAFSMECWEEYVEVVIEIGLLLVVIKTVVLKIYICMYIEYVYIMIIEIISLYVILKIYHKERLPSPTNSTNRDKY